MARFRPRIESAQLLKPPASDANAAGLLAAIAALGPSSLAEGSVTFTPYAWLISLNGSQTVRGRTVDIDETFFDIVHDTIGKGGQLFAAMIDFECTYGDAVLRINNSFFDLLLFEFGAGHGIASAAHAQIYRERQR